MIAQAQIDWSQVGQIWGPLGLGFVLLLLLIVAGAKWFKSTMEGTLADARKERDAMRDLVNTQANKFLDSLKIRDDIQEKGFDEILRELRNTNPRRK
jgi:hypothetical protein